MLLNIRNDEDIYTKYSFPSKMVEYLLSGTPLLTTKLSGIPDEYYDYCYTTTTRDAQKIADQIDEILHDEGIAALGDKAKRYVKERKNSSAQAAHIAHFLKEHI